MSRLFLFPNHFFCQVSKATNPYELEATKLIIFHIVLPPFPPPPTHPHSHRWPYVIDQNRVRRAISRPQRALF